MARGWESKSVEMQMDERAQPERPGPNNLADAARLRELELLRLSHLRLCAEINSISNPRLQEIKRRALTHVEQRIKGLEKAVETAEKDS